MTSTPTPARIGPSTPMPSVPLELGKYVTVRPPFSKAPKVDGTRRVFFQVPERLRPSDWPSLIPLPSTGERRGDLADADEVARIQTDAGALYDKLLAARSGVAAAREKRDLPNLIASWQETQRYKAKRPKTQKGYDYHAGLIDDWSEALRHPAVSTISADRIETFLSLYDDRPTTRRHVLVVLKMLLKHAVKLGWIDKSPADDITVKAPKTKVTIWEQADVEFYVQASWWFGQPALGALILTEWEIGQRLTDARLFRGSLSGISNTPAEYSAADGVFRFWQSKTNSYVTIPVSDRLRAMLDAVWSNDTPYLFVDTATGRPFEEQRLGHVFIDLRNACPGGRRLVLRALRHSCVVQLARAGCTVPEIASITGHSIFSVERILSTYLPRDNQVAWNAQAKRGLVSGEMR
jgi:hypothetical protein